MDIELLIDVLDPEKKGEVSLDRLLALASRLKKDRSLKKKSMLKSGLKLLKAAVMLAIIVLVGIFTFIEVEHDDYEAYVVQNLLLKVDMEKAIPVEGIINDILNLTSTYDEELDNTVREMWEKHKNQTLWDQLEDNGFVSTFALRNPWEHMENAAWFVFTIITTIGYGHIVPKTEGAHWLVIFYSVPSIICMAYFIKKLINFYKSCPCPKGSVTQQIFALIVFFSVELAFGGYMFSIFEEDWTFSQGVYFTWVTISTIGFGDYTLSDEEEGFWETALNVFILVNGLFLFSYVLIVVGNIIERVTKPERWNEKFSRAILNKIERITIPRISLVKRSPRNKSKVVQDETTAQV